MRAFVILRYLGFVLLLNAAFLLISAGISFIQGDSSTTQLTYTFIITALLGVFPIIFVPETEEISHIEGITIVVSGWLFSCVVGMIPYILWGGEFTVTNAWFESVSGYTTTGASILNNIEALPNGLLFWRASTHWIGGVGIIIFVLAVLPSFGFITSILYKTEISPAALRFFKMRSKDALRIILFVYLGLTVLESVSLYFCGLNIFDAVTHSFATVATGGFSTKGMSIAAFGNLAAEIVIMIFMILSGMNFVLLFKAVLGDFASLKTSTVIKYYLFVNLAAILFVALNTYGSNYDTFPDALRYAGFQVLSIGTSTGFATSDSSVWPGFSQLIIIFFTLQCAMAGSTSGGIKVDRIVIMIKSFSTHLKQLIHPKGVFSITIDNQKIEPSLVFTTLLYIITYMVVVFISTMILSLFNVDLLSAFSGSAAAMGNVGPGLSEVGSLENYSHFPMIGKWVLSFVMILGRLEIFGFIIFLLRGKYE